MFRSILLIFTLLFSVSALADNDKYIQILNGTSDLDIIFGNPKLTGNNDIRMSFGDYSGDKYRFDYGEGLIRTIFGDFKNIVDGTGKTNVDSEKSVWAAGSYGASGKDTSLDPSNFLVSGIFFGQTYVIKLLQAAMLKLTTLVLWLYGVMFLLTTFWSLAKVGGDERSVWGSLGNKNIPYRMLFTLILIFPTTSGYTIGQLLNTQLNLLANYGGRYVYLSSISLLSEDFIKRGVKSTVQSRMRNLLNSNALMKDIFKASYCTANMQKKWNKFDSDIHDDSGSRKGINFGRTVIFTDDGIVLNFGPRKVGDQSEFVILSDLTVKGDKNKQNPDMDKYLASSAITGKPVDYCGSVTLPFKNINILNQDYKNLIANEKVNNSISMMMLIGLLNASQISEEFWWDNVDDTHDGKSKISKLKEGVYTEFANKILKMENQFLESAKAYAEKFSLNGVTTDQGRFFGISVPWGTNDKDLKNIAAEHLSEGLKDVSGVQQAYFKGILNLTLESNKNEKDKEHFKALYEEVVNGVTNEMFDGKKLSPYTKLLAYGYNYGWIDAGGWFSTLSSISIGENLMAVNSPVSAGPNFAFDKVSDDRSADQLSDAEKAFSISKAEYNRISMYLDPATFKSASVTNLLANVVGLQKGAVAQYGKSEEGLANWNKNPYKYENIPYGVYFAQQIGYNPDEFWIHPLMQLKKSGEKMQMIATTILGASAVGSFLGSDSKDKNGNKTQMANFESMENQSVISGFLSKAAGLGTMFAIILLIAGFFLGTYLPMLPTIYWIMGVIAWATGMMLNFISIPIVGLILAFSQAEDFAGRTINFFMALIESMIRPVLLVIALFVTVIFQAIFVSLGSRLLNQAYMSADVTVFSLGFLFYIIIYVFMNYMILTSSAAMIKSLPEEVIKRINGVSAANDEGEQGAQKLSNVLQTSRNDAQLAVRGVLGK